MQFAAQNRSRHVVPYRKRRSVVQLAFYPKRAPRVCFSGGPALVLQAARRVGEPVQRLVEQGLPREEEAAKTDQARLDQRGAGAVSRGARAVRPEATEGH